MYIHQGIRQQNLTFLDVICVQGPALGCCCCRTAFRAGMQVLGYGVKASAAGQYCVGRIGLVVPCTV